MREGRGDPGRGAGARGRAETGGGGGGQVGAGMTFGSWLLFCMPFCVTLVLCTWGLLRWRYPPQLRVIRLDLARDQARPARAAEGVMRKRREGEGEAGGGYGRGKGAGLG